MPKAKLMIPEELLQTLEIKILSVDFHSPTTWWNFKKVNSPFSRLYYVTEGETFVTHGGTRYHLHPDDVFLVPCFTFCDMFCPEQFSHYHVNFTSRMKGDIDLFSLFECDYLYKGDQQHLRMFKRLMELNPESKLRNLNPYQQLKDKITNPRHDDLHHDHPAAVFESEGLLRLLLVPFLQTIRESADRHKVNQRFAEVFHYIEDNLSRHIRLEELAGVVSLNPTYFSNLFTEMTGVRPIEYISRKRIEKSHMLLLSTDYTVKEIARKLGFANTAHFSRTFKKYQGISPIDYRKQHEMI